MDGEIGGFLFQLHRIGLAGFFGVLFGPHLFVFKHLWAFASVSVMQDFAGSVCGFVAVRVCVFVRG